MGCERRASVCEQQQRRVDGWNGRLTGVPGYNAVEGGAEERREIIGGSLRDVRSAPLALHLLLLLLLCVLLEHLVLVLGGSLLEQLLGRKLLAAHNCVESESLLQRKRV